MNCKRKHIIMIESVNTGYVKSAIVFGFGGYEVQFNDKHVYCTAVKNIDDVRDAIGKSPVMSLDEVLAGKWSRLKKMKCVDLATEFDRLVSC